MHCDYLTVTLKVSFRVITFNPVSLLSHLFLLMHDSPSAHTHVLAIGSYSLNITLQS